MKPDKITRAIEKALTPDPLREPCYTEDSRSTGLGPTTSPAASPSPQAWRPISEAPKDRKLRLLRCRYVYDQYRVYIGNYMDYGHGPSWFGLDMVCLEPSHFMDLPSPDLPAPGRKEAGT